MTQQTFTPTKLVKRTVRVTYCAEWQDYVCRVYVNGKEDARAVFRSHNRAEVLAAASRLVQA